MRVLFAAAVVSGLAACSAVRAPEAWRLAEPRRFPLVEAASDERALGRVAAAGDGAAHDVLSEIALELESVEAGERAPVRFEPVVARRFERRAGEGMLRGTCVVVPGILGKDSAAHLVEPLVDDGWAVAVVWPPILERAVSTMREGRELPREELGASVAREVDRTIRSSARIAQLELRWLHARHPELAERPVILVGESMGAIAGVGMAATGEVPFDAAFFVAGGGGFLEVANATPLRPVLFGDLPIDDEAFVRGFRAHSRLDPLEAARTLRGAPVVVMTADLDFIVPSARQDALWSALGEPPRFVFERGHLELFVFGRWNIVPTVRAIAAQAEGRPPAAAALAARANGH